MKAALILAALAFTLSACDLYAGTPTTEETARIQL